MPSCPRCHDAEGRPREIPVTVTRWTSAGSVTTLRCPLCGWEGTEVASAAAEVGAAADEAARAEPPTRAA